MYMHAHMRGDYMYMHAHMRGDYMYMHAHMRGDYMYMHAHMRGDSMFNEVLQQCSVVVCQGVLDHGQHVERRVGEILKPLTTPVHCSGVI